MAKELTGVLVTKDKVEVITIEDKLDEFYRILECECIDITQIMLNGYVLDVVIDDEGLLKEDNFITYSDANRILVGNILVVKHNGPDLVSLNDDEIQAVIN